MKARDLCLEMETAIAAMEPRDVDQLVGLGIAETLILNSRMVGISRVRGDRSGVFYEPDPASPDLAFITPCRVWFPDTPESTKPDESTRQGWIVDLVAWCEKTPARFRLRVGTAGWIGAIGPQFLEPDPVPIFRGPLEWLRHDCVGLVPLSRKRSEVYRLLVECAGGVIAEDAEHEAELRSILQRPYRGPPVYRAYGRERRHAA